MQWCANSLASGNIHHGVATHHPLESGSHHHDFVQQSTLEEIVVCRLGPLAQLHGVEREARTAVVAENHSKVHSAERGTTFTIFIWAELLASSA
jgi:hypothetical protein